jgi:tetratricopeptide (TPR) repeat protein
MLGRAILTFFVVVIWIAAVACGGPAERKAEYLAKAQVYIQQHNFPKARVALRNVLKIDPKDADAYFLYAQVEEKEKNWRNAFTNYIRVVELRPDHREALIKLGKFYLEARATEKTDEVADKVLARHPGDPSAETLKAAALALRGGVAEALIKAEAISGMHPTEPDTAILLATLYIAQQRLVEAESALRRAVEAHPEDTMLLDNLGATLIRAGRLEEAERVFLRMVSTEPNEFGHRLRLAALYDYRKELTKAEAVLREAVRLDPESEERRLALVEFLATRKDVKEGEAALLEAQRDLPHAMKVRFGLGTLYEFSRQPAKARAVYQGIVDEEKTRPPGLEAQVKLAVLDLAEGRREEAERRVGAVLKENPQASDAVLLQGKMALARNDAKEAVQAFRTVLKDQPAAADVQSLLGQAYLLSGEPRLARESLETAVRLNPRQMDAQRALAGLEAAEGKREAAKRRLEHILKEEPKDLPSLGLLFDLQVADKEWGVTDQTIARLRNADRDQFMADLAEGRLQQARRQWDKAVAAYERALMARPDDPAPLSALVGLETSLGRAPSAQARLANLLKERPDHPYAHGLLGEVLLLEGDRARAEREFVEATRLKPDWVAPWLTRATLKLAEQKPEDAVAIMKAGLGANPRSEELRLLLASTLAEMDQTDQAIQEYDAILRGNPRAVVAANNLAVLLTDKKGDPQSLNRALALSRDFEKTATDAFFLDTLGWVHFKMGHHEEAVRLIRQAVSKAPEQPVLNYHLGMAYHRSGEFRAAREHLEKAIQAGKPFPGQREARSVLAGLTS